MGLLLGSLCFCLFGRDQHSIVQPAALCQNGRHESRLGAYLAWGPFQVSPPTDDEMVLYLLRNHALNMLGKGSCRPLSRTPA